MRHLWFALLAAQGPLACGPPVGSDAPDCPAPAVVEATRRPLQDCASLVDVDALAVTPTPPACPAVDAGPSLCLDGGTAPGGYVSTQAELEVYRGCTRIDDSITVTGVCSLEPLRALQEVDGSLAIGGGEEPSTTATLVDLQGLNALRLVRGLTISNLPSLVSIDGLDALEHVGVGGFGVMQLTGVAHLHGPDTLRTVEGSFTIGFSSSLQLVDGFEGLESVESVVSLYHGDSLVCVGGFSSLRSLPTLEIGGASVVAIPGLTRAIAAAEPTLQLIDAPAFDFATLPALDGLDGLDLIRTSAEDLRAFAGLRRLGTLRIYGDETRSLAGLESLRELGTFDLEDLPDVKDVAALGGVTRVDTLRIPSAGSFDPRCTFASLVEVGDYLLDGTPNETIVWPPALERIAFLSVRDNGTLASLGEAPAGLRVQDAQISGNAPLTDDDVEQWLAGIDVDGTAKYGRNGDATPSGPCPWFNDGECDRGDVCADDSEADCR